MTLRTTLFFICGMVLSTAILGQDSPIGALPMQYNSSFAGSVDHSRAVTDVSFSKPTRDFYDGDGYSFSASYDKFFTAIGSGVGITAFYGRYSSSYDINNPPLGTDPKATLTSSASNISLAIAPKLSVKGKYTLSPSLEIRYGGTRMEISEAPGWEDSLKTGFSSRAAILFNTKKYYVGYSVRIYKSKDIRYALESKFYSTLQIGYTYQKNPNSHFAITPQVVITIRNRETYLSGYDNKDIVYWSAYNLGFRYDNFLWSIISDNYNIDGKKSYIPGFQVGWQSKSLRILFSTTFKYEYSANLTFRYIFQREGHNFNNVF